MSLLQRLRDVLGLDEDYGEGYYYEGEEEIDRGHQAGLSPRAHGSQTASMPSNKVIGMPGIATGQTEMLLMQSRSFDEMPQAVTVLRDRKSIILDLTLMDVEQAQRCADYVAGATYAIDGDCRQIGEAIFLFTPSSVQISHHASVPQPNPDPFLDYTALSPILTGRSNGRTQPIPPVSSPTGLPNPPYPLPRAYPTQIDPTAL